MSKDDLNMQVLAVAVADKLMDNLNVLLKLLQDNKGTGVDAPKAAHFALSVTRHMLGVIMGTILGQTNSPETLQELCEPVFAQVKDTALHVIKEMQENKGADNDTGRTLN